MLLCLLNVNKMFFRVVSKQLMFDICSMPSETSLVKTKSRLSALEFLVL